MLKPPLLDDKLEESHCPMKFELRIVGNTGTWKTTGKALRVSDTVRWEFAYAGGGLLLCHIERQKIGVVHVIWRLQHIPTASLRYAKRIPESLSS
jgi:hypothetical protein